MTVQCCMLRDGKRRENVGEPPAESKLYVCPACCAALVKLLHEEHEKAVAKPAKG